MADILTDDLSVSQPAEEAFSDVTSAENENQEASDAPSSDLEASPDVTDTENENPETDLEGGDDDVESSVSGDVPGSSLYDSLPDAVDPFAPVDPSDLPVSGELTDGETDSDMDEEDPEEVQEVAPKDDAAGDPDLIVYRGQLYTDDGVPVDLLGVLPASVTATNAVYTPTAWQVNLAQNRAFGEHYLMWAQRVSSGSSYYWRYYLALGRDMTYASNTYRYTDAEVYSYYSYNSSVTYDVSVSSGSVSGSSYLVYSDLYFDYVGVDPASNGFVYMAFVMFLIIITLLMIGGKRNV